ncbi:MAG: PQQ-like beta-propeller repeat protein [Deltaproteobacteria bacterium]|nr:MAG: PQQ-like beta-propeller repeat protein [Deltaproteobacteria bacterium]
MVRSTAPLLALCACLPDPLGRCQTNTDCERGPAGSFCAENVCQGPPRGSIEALPARFFARSETVHVRTIVDRSHGEPAVHVLLGSGAVAAAREPDGAFGADLPLRFAPAGSEGPVPFAVEVKDDLGHLTLLPGSIQIDDAPPRVSVDLASIPSPAAVRGSSVPLRVVVQDLTPVTLVWTAGGAQGAAMQQPDGSFIAAIDTSKAPAGAPSLDVAFTATDAVGNASAAHASIPLTRLKFVTRHDQPIASIVVSDVIWAIAQSEIWILHRDGTSLTKGSTDATPVAEAATDGHHVFFARSDDKVCRMGSDGSIQLCCGPFTPLTGGPILLGSNPIVSTRHTATTSSRLVAVLDSNGICNQMSWLTTVDFAAAMPAVGVDGIVYSGASQAIVAAKFDGSVWTGGHPTSETPSYRGQAAIQGNSVLVSTTSATIDTFASVPLNSDAPTPTTVQAAVAGTVISSPTLAEDGTVTIATNDKRIVALKTDGNIRWNATLLDNATASPTHGAGGLVYVGTAGGEIIALSGDDGSAIWSQKVGAPVRGPLAPGCDGLLYAATDASVVALVIDAAGLADSDWPRAGHDIRGSGDARRPLRSASGACLE